jgi:hypothetical protein
MESKIDQLLSLTEQMFKEPWTDRLAGSERVCFLVFDPSEIRKVDFRLAEFEMAAKMAGRKWVSVSLQSFFPEWMAAHEYRDAYFEDPESLVDQLETEFKDFAINKLVQAIAAGQPDDTTVIAIRDVTAIFGFQRLSDILNGASHAFRGRVLVFFPGEYDKNHYRLLNARDGWSYLARPISL